jgi:hypothetical protein
MTPREQLIDAISNACRENVQLRFGENALNVMESGGRLGLSGGEADEIARCALQAIEDQDYVLIKSKDEDGNPLIVASADAVQQISTIAIEEFREVVRQEMRAQS